MVGTGLLHHLSREGEGSARSQHHAMAAEAQTGRAGGVVEAASFRRQIIGAMAGFDVVVVGSAIECEMASSGRLSAVGIVGHFVGTKNIAAVMDLGVVVQFVNVAVFFLLNGTDDGSIFELRGRASIADG